MSCERLKVLGCSLVLGAWLNYWVFRIVFAGIDNAFREWKPVSQIVLEQQVWLSTGFYLAPLLFVLSYLLFRVVFKE